MTSLPEADGATRAFFIDWLDVFAGYVREVDYASARPLFHPDVLAFGTHRDVIPGLEAWIATQRAARYNGKEAPRLLLVSPIAHETLARLTHVDAEARNRELARYTDAMRAVAVQEKRQVLGARERVAREAVRLEVLHGILALAGRQADLQALLFAAGVDHRDRTARDEVGHPPSQGGEHAVEEAVHQRGGITSAQLAPDVLRFLVLAALVT